MSMDLGKSLELKIENILKRNNFSYTKDSSLIGKVRPDFISNGWIIEAKVFSILPSIQGEIRDIAAKKVLVEKFGYNYKWLGIIHSNIYFFPSNSLILPFIFLDSFLIEPLLGLLPSVLRGKVSKNELFALEMDYYYDKYSKKDKAFPYVPYGFLLTLDQKPENIRGYIKSLSHGSMLKLFNFIRIAEMCKVIKRERNPKSKRENVYALLDKDWRIFVACLRWGYGDYRKNKEVEKLQEFYNKAKIIIK